jgi:hypothetical protein
MFGRQSCQRAAVAVIPELEALTRRSRRQRAPQLLSLGTAR